MVAGVTARPDPLWKFTLSIAIVFRRQPLLISPGALILDGLLAPSDCEARFAQDKVDYDSIIPFKERLLETAWTNF